MSRYFASVIYSCFLFDVFPDTFFRIVSITYCYRWSWLEARSKICSAQRQAKFRAKNKVKFRTSSKRIYFVFDILVHCEGVDFKVTCFKFMTVFITRRDAACFLSARVTTILPLCLLWNSTFYAPFGMHQTAAMLDETRGREASTGWVWGLLSWHSCREVEGEAWR